jgi:solute carrier family 25 (mitochondrial ornithine transporter) member 2/15
VTSGPIKLCQTIWKENGVRGFYHGLISTFAREMPGYFFFFGAYELGRSLMTEKGKRKDELSPLRTAFCGGLGGVSFWVRFVFATQSFKILYLQHNL